MAEIKLSSRKNYYGGYDRTPDYRFTINSLDDPRLLELKQLVKESNRVARDRRRNPGPYDSAETLAKWMPIQRVRIMPRGPRAENARKDYPHHRYAGAYDSYLPMRYGTHFDVYVGTDTHAEYKFKEELSTGLRPSEMKKINELQHQIWKMQAEARSRIQ